MSAERPIPVGSYELLLDVENPDASIRIIRMELEADAIQAHVHRQSNQTYIVLEGSVAVEVDGVERILGRYESLDVPHGSLHRTRPLEGAAVVMNISTPPLAADDQAPFRIDA